MPVTDSSSVQITINVVDANSGEVINRVTKSLNALGDAGAGGGRRMAVGLKEAGEAGTKAGQKIGEAMKEAGGHITTSLDSVRLLSQEFGLRMPRALESMAARIPAVTNAINGMLGALAGVAIAEILVRAGIEVYHLYEKWLDTNKAVDDYINKAAEASQQKLFDSSSFDSTIGYLRQANTQIDRLAAKKKEWGNASLLDKIFLPHSTAPRFTTNDDKALAQAMEVSDRESLMNLRQSHELMLKNIDAHEKLSKASANSSGAIAIERAAARQRDSENLSYVKAVEHANAEIYRRAHERDPKKYPGTYTPSPDAGRQEFSAAENNADVSSRAQSIELAFKEQVDLMHLKNQADQEGLQGEKLLQAQRVAAIEDLSARYKNQTEHNRQYAAEEAEINRRYDNEESTRLRQQTDELKRRIALESQRGLTGLSANDARAKAAKDQVDRDLASGKFYGNRDQQRDYASGLKRAIDAGNNSDTEKLQQQFNDRLAQMDASRSDRYASESQRITIAAQRSVQEITRAWREMYGQLGAMDQRRVQSYQALQDEIGKINADAAQQRMEARQRLEDQTQRAEEAAARYGQNPEQERTQAILDQYSDRYRQLEELRQHDAENADLYRRQEIAAEQEKNGRLIDLQRQMRDRLAGHLRGYFDHPMEALKRQGEEAASKIAAGFLLKLQPNGLGGYGDAGIGGRHGGIFGGLGALVHPNAARNSVTASSSVMSATTATIYVQNATLAGGGIGGGFSSGSGSGIGSTIASIGGGAGGFGGITSTGAAGAGGSSISSTLSSLPGMSKSVAELGKEMGIGKMPNVSQLGSKLGGGKLGSILGSSTTAGLAGGGLGLFSAYKSNGGFGGALGGAFSGAKIGMIVGGPAGAAIGAVAGGIMGAFGFGGRTKAEQYDKHQVQKRIKDDLQSYEAGAMDYQTAFDDMDALSREAKMTTRQWGSGGKGYYNDHIKGEITAAQTRLTNEQKAGRSEFGMTAAQFHNGGFISGFGSLATSNDEGWIHAQRGEMVMHQQAAATHSSALQAMLGGASHADMAAYYGATKRAAAPSGSSVNLVFNSHDAKGAYQLFMDNKHHVRAALNASYAENSGGADFA